MKFKTDEEIKRLRSMKLYLENYISPYWKKIIVKKFKVINSMSSGMDSQPVDAYRLIGQQVIRIELVEELNQIIMDQSGRGYQFIRVWVKELYELWKLSHEMLGNARQMARALSARGNTTGFYDPDDPEPKTTTAGSTH
jgi:hypothetical protein